MYFSTDFFQTVPVGRWRNRSVHSSKSAVGNPSILTSDVQPLGASLMQCKASIPALLGLLICLAAPMAAPVGKAKAAGPSPDILDQKRIHAEYNEGNFEGVLHAIEGFMARNKTYSLEDS